MLPAIENGFTFIAFLMFLAGGLLAMEKYTKWKVFNWVPPLVWIYILNMVFCTLGLYNSEGVSAAYGVLKNNLLYAMIFVMLLRCDFRKIAKLSGRMIAIFLGCSITLALGFIVGFRSSRDPSGAARPSGALPQLCTLPGSAAPPTWLPCRMLCRSMPALTPALLRSTPSATPYGLRCCSLL